MIYIVVHTLFEPLTSLETTEQRNLCSPIIVMIIINYQLNLNGFLIIVRDTVW